MYLILSLYLLIFTGIGPRLCACTTVHLWFPPQECPHKTIYLPLMPLTGHGPCPKNMVTNDSHCPSFVEHPATILLIRQTASHESLSTYISHHLGQVHNPLPHLLNGVGLWIDNPLQSCNLILEVSLPLCLMINLPHN